ncbi:hypothetical protein [Nostoc sp. TCL26-01]|uniref:hypothetical protein n=1 Tax=Nostoc sp. TCL26-01 TaxID=2576904 RepID=UPI0015BCA71A|nr:hypothetical protein [Nostoc sp. TCL26-01]QLE58907.1 hypothetical protein FD725_27455 [Nostoc sp. TCL26-01]
MKDHISLIAAAAGGFMLSVALAGILRGAPVMSWEQSRVNSYPATSLRMASVRSDETMSYVGIPK